MHIWKMGIPAFCGDHFYLILIPYLLHTGGGRREGRKGRQAGHDVIPYS